MSKKAFWSVFSMLMVVLLLLMSCGPKGAPTPVTPTPTPGAPAAPVPGAPALTPAPTPAASEEEPKYGGTMNVVVPILGSGGGEIFAPLLPSAQWGEGWVVEQILTSDYSRSKAGTGEFELGSSISSSPSVPALEFITGWLAESYEVPQEGVWVLNIRQGVHWALDPASEASRLVGGREMTADDVKSSLELFRDTPNSRALISKPGLFKNVTVEKTGPWQLTLRTPVDGLATYVWMLGGGGAQYVWPKEWLEKYAKINEWRNMVGTGPYMVSDLVSGSVITLKRNPNYWQKDPVGAGKGNQLPYPDTVKLFIIPDISTRLATMRTGQGDVVEDIQWEDAKSLISSRPTLQSNGYIPWPLAVGMRTDKQDMPYSKVKVRQALMMATDFEAIKRDLYAGQAEILVMPVDHNAKAIYRPIEELPPSVRTLYKYNPEGAKQLLAEAGYPTGFKAKMVVKNFTADVDLAAVIKAMWAKVGVDLELQPKEITVYNSIAQARSEEDFIMHWNAPYTYLSQRSNFTAHRGGSAYNASLVNDPPGKDPVIEKIFQTMSSSFTSNPQKSDQALREGIPYMLEQAYYVTLPAPLVYRVWQPWLKGYYGEGGLSSAEPWAAYPWIDQDLKEQMTGRR